MKKCLIYLLTLVMVLSPMAVFAGTGEDNDPETVPAEEVIVETESEEGADKINDGEEVVKADEAVPETVEEAAPAEETPAEETPEELILEEEPQAVLKAAAGEAHWEGDKYVDADGKAYTGLFKAPKKNGSTGNGLYYAESDGTVNPETRIVTVETGDKYEYEVTTDGIWNKVDVAGAHSYLVLNDTAHNDCSIVAIKGIWGTDKKYYVGDKGLARTEAGLVADENGGIHFVNPGGLIQSSEAMVYDPSVSQWRYIGTDGLVQMGETKFPYAGAMWYRDPNGYVNKAGNTFVTVAGATKYYTNDDGSLFTAANQIVPYGGRKYITGEGGAIRTAAGPVNLGGNWYVAEPGGAIHTGAGFYEVGGQLYYVTNSEGVLKVNKAFKVSGKKYHAAADGTIMKGVHKWGKYYYYSTSSGALRSKAGRIKWNNNYYIVKKGGKVYTGKKVKYKGKYYIAKKSGIVYRGIFTWKKNMYYADSKGRLRTKAGLFKYDGNRYYSRKGGKLYKNTLFKAGSKKYLAQSDGRIKIGYFEWKGKHYITNGTGSIYTKAGIYTYNNKQYFVEKGGAMAKEEFVTYKDDHYYVNAKGEIVKSAFKYKGIKITPNSKTGVISLEDYWKVFPNEKPTED